MSSAVRVERYDERYFAHNEHVVMCMRRHPAILLRPALPALAWFLVAFLLTPAVDVTLFSAILWLVATAFLVRLGWRALFWWIDHIILTNQRVLEVYGILTRVVASMPLTKVTDFAYRRSVLGRVLGYGEFSMESAGQSQALSRIVFVPDPDVFYRTMAELVSPQWVPGDSDEQEARSAERRGRAARAGRSPRGQR